ncbi:MAG: dihydroorotate dehydrogenase electron transfer subunit [Candidatus Eisenbacteria bacterium]|nr:dihydroorotate dehydrogenase electron transfer subunit [Candidatus Eisenbacteria bacterium]
MPRTEATRGRIRARRPVAEGSWLFTLETDPALPEAEPGQFVQVEVPGRTLLRRPFSVAGTPERGRLELLFEVRGDGTRDLASLPDGGELALTGPLGRAFEKHPAGAAAVLVAGGIGVAGLRMLAFRLAAARVPTTAFVGARGAGRLLHRELPPAGDHLRIEPATDDGSEGRPGTVCELFEERSGELPDGARVYLCGPRPMIRTAGRTAVEHGLRAFALLEETMACGVGACRGCVVETRDGYRTVCADGPVFDVADLMPVWRSDD